MSEWWRDNVIYSIRQVSTGRRYIGLTWQWAVRWGNHRSHAKCGTRHPLYDAMRETGMDDFQFTLLAGGLDDASARRRERELIAANNAWFPAGFNLPHASLYVPSAFPEARLARRGRRAINETADAG